MASNKPAGLPQGGPAPSLLQTLDVALWSIAVLLLVYLAVLASHQSVAAARILAGAAIVAAVRVWLSL